MSEREPLAEVERALSAVLSKLLLKDEERARRLARLEGSVVEICLRDTGWRLYALPGAHGVRLARQWDERVDVSIVGRPADFIAFARASRRGDSFGAGRIELSGDLAVAQQVQTLLGELDIDWADVLAPLLGEIPAHKLTRLLKGAFEQAGAAARRFEHDLADWLHHEARLAPTRGEIEQLGQAIFSIADDVERLEARVKRCERGGPAS